MSKQPVIFLAFANDQDAYLNSLKRESRSINHALEALDDKQLIKISREESAGIDEVFHNFNRFKGKIAVFHYAGHADGEHLHLEAGNANASGLADLIAQEENLKLVFLNGCSTQGQVEYLMSLGVKAVIATSIPINDTKATEFAEYFYRSLANKNTIKGAFNFAASYLKTKYSDIDQPEIVNHRGLKLRKEKTKKEMPWGLYLNDDAEDILEWTLPTQFTTTIKRPSELEYEVNEFIYPVLEEMAIYEPSLKNEMVDKDGNDIDDREYLAKIIENFPWPIGAQLRRLVSNDQEMNKPSLPRLKQIVSTYTVSLQLLFYILLSQLWEEKRKDSKEFNIYMADILGMGLSSFHYFDFMSHIKQVLTEFKGNNRPLFIEEFDVILSGLEEKGELYDSYLFLDSLRNRLAEDNNLEAEIWQTCADAEYSLSVILCKAAFLAKYQMLTVRDIMISNPRHKTPAFKHFMGRLNAYDGDFLSLFKKPRSYEQYTDSRSVILVKSLTTLEPFLNLSPFVIDKNAFGDAKATATDLFMYAFNEGGEYQYLVSRQNIYRALIQEGDRINTGMEEKSEVQSRSRRSRRGRSSAEPPNRPYAPLKEQFELIKKDLSV